MIKQGLLLFFLAFMPSHGSGPSRLIQEHAPVAGADLTVLETEHVSREGIKLGPHVEQSFWNPDNAAPFFKLAAKMDLMAIETDFVLVFASIIADLEENGFRVSEEENGCHAIGILVGSKFFKTSRSLHLSSFFAVLKEFCQAPEETEILVNTFGPFGFGTAREMNGKSYWFSVLLSFLEAEKQMKPQLAKKPERRNLGLSLPGVVEWIEENAETIVEDFEEDTVGDVLGAVVMGETIIAVPEMGIFLPAVGIELALLANPDPNSIGACMWESYDFWGNPGGWQLNTATYEFCYCDMVSSMCEWDCFGAPCWTCLTPFMISDAQRSGWNHMLNTWDTACHI